ncbi:hypothetical protein [Clostridium porci]|uniref:Uncharacterized protein n=1 Tax=Clostridium porci TaxID=2605778 RepID=A0A7X2NKI2_9CLOT|nr:hypothetical protein [Clostridium porci]MSS36569.1 hypothetical protein [Clostridium porci]
MYIAMKVRKLLEEQGEFKKLADIPLCVLYNETDTMSVKEHILLNASALKDGYMEIMTIGEPAIDVGVTIGNLMWRNEDGILILEENEVKQLQKTEIHNDKYTLYVVSSLKEALEIYKKNTKKAAGKRGTKKAEKVQAKPADAGEEEKVNVPGGEDAEAMSQEFGMNPPEDPAAETENANESAEEMDSDVSEDVEDPVLEAAPVEETEEAGMAEKVEAAITYDQTDRTNALKFPDVIDDPQYLQFKRELDQHGVTIAMAPYVLTALQTSEDVESLYDRLNATVCNVEDVLCIYDSLQGDYDHFKEMTNRIVPYDAYVDRD